MLHKFSHASVAAKQADSTGRGHRMGRAIRSPMTSTFLEQAFVRVTNRRADGFVEFDFSLDGPDLYLEMILPESAFQEFCRAKKVRFVTDEVAARWQRDREKWRGGAD